MNRKKFQFWGGLTVITLSLLIWPLANVSLQAQEVNEDLQESQTFQFEESSEADINPLAPELTPTEEYFRARIINIEQTSSNGQDHPGPRLITLEIVSGDRSGEIIEVMDQVTFGVQGSQEFEVGERVVVGQIQSFDETIYFIADRYRLTPILLIIAAFFAAAVIFGGWKGLTSTLGLVVSILVLALFIVPSIIAGKNPLFITLVGAFMIAGVSLYLAHGFRKRTSVALLSTLITLSIGIGLAILFVDMSGLFGLGSEAAFYLQTFPGGELNLRGLLLGGIIIGTLGVLDDITTSQAATVEEISRANPKLDAIELYKRGRSVGHEHIAALINTLVLAYAGASLPLFLLFTLNQSQPLWVIFNSEFIAEEIVRTIVGSMCLILAVPITTFLSAQLLRVKEGEEHLIPDEPTGHHHHHH